MTFPDNLVDRSKGIMHLFIMFGTSLAQPTTVVASVLTIAENWRSRPCKKLSFDDSLLLELGFVHQSSAFVAKLKQRLKSLTNRSVGKGRYILFCVL